MIAVYYPKINSCEFYSGLTCFGANCFIIVSGMKHSSVWMVPTWEAFEFNSDPIVENEIERIHCGG